MGLLLVHAGEVVHLAGSQTTSKARGAAEWSREETGARCRCCVSVMTHHYLCPDYCRVYAALVSDMCLWTSRSN